MGKSYDLDFVDKIEGKIRKGETKEVRNILKNIRRNDINDGSLLIKFANFSRRCGLHNHGIRFLKPETSLYISG